MENINELIIYSSGFFILLFTQWICDPLNRYSYGQQFIYIQAIVASLNVLLIVVSVVLAVRREWQKRVWTSKWKVYFEELEEKKEIFKEQREIQR